MTPSALAEQKLYDVLLEQQHDGTYQASVLGWNDCVAIADTEQEAVAKVQAALNDRIAKAKIIQVEANPTQSIAYRHPWMKFAERLSQNPLLDEVEQYITAARQTEQETEGGI
jgi:23S rRNA maturation-related 3'-5' exoribonuclease YhaM